MKFHHCLIIAITFYTLTSCGEKPAARLPIGSMEWLIGSWQGTYQGKPFYEAWRKVNDSTLMNFHIEMINGDTVVKENSIILVGHKATFYQSSNGAWELSKSNDAELVFVSPTKTSPYQIRWAHENGHWITDIKNPGKSDLHYDLTLVPWLDANVNQYVANAIK